MQKVIDGPIRVLQIIHSSGITGPGKSLYNFTKYADRRKFSIDVLCPPEGPMADDLRAIGIRVVPFVLKRVWEPVGAFRLFRTLAREKYHIFCIHSGQLNAFSRLMGKLLGIPAIIATEHFSTGEHIWIKNKAVLRLHLLFHRLSNAMVDKIIAVSEVGRLSYIKRQGIDPEKIVAISAGVDMEGFDAAGRSPEEIRGLLGLGQGVPVVGMVARLSPEKGQSIFIRAAKEVLGGVPDARFLIAGEGKERENIERLIRELGLKSKIIIIGFQKNIYDFMNIMDILVQPSLPVSESFGFTCVEGMANARAVIASGIECFREIVDDKRTGLIFRVGDHMDLAEKILILLNDAHMRKKMGLAAREAVREKFDIRAIKKNTEDLFMAVLKSKGFTMIGDNS